MKFNRKHFVLAPAMLLTVAVSSAYAQDPARDPNVREQTRGDVQDTTNRATGAPAAGGTATLTDGQILQIVRNLNDAEIKQADEALGEADSEEVKQVAEMIKQDHEAKNEMIDELLDGELNLEDSPLSETLADQSEETHELLQNLADEQYECAYLQQQVAQHDAALELGKSQLAPNAKDPAVAQFVNSLPEGLEHHKQMAQQALGNIPACGAEYSANEAPEATADSRDDTDTDR